MKLVPLLDYVVLEPIEEEETKIGAIVVPDTAKERPQLGRVVAVGPGRKKEDGTRSPMAVQEGDTVIYSKYAGTEFEHQGKEYLVLRESDILAIVQ
ncbi:MAG: 10 kDa chaperonin [Candidatus Poribacteria bacterium]|nr:MAG: 10 kDa chaperonin [Candidatus Poribacteria bacterium]